MVHDQFAQIAKTFGRQLKDTAELASVVNYHSKNLELQFQRIAQIQAQLDQMKSDLLKMSRRTEG